MLRDIGTVFWRDWIVLKKRLLKFIFSRMVAPILYLTVFGLGLGRSVNLNSGSYLDFIVPGIIALNSMNISFHSVISIHAERVYHKSLDEYLLAPISAEAFLIGKILGAVTRALISSAIIILLAKIFGAKFFLSPILIVVLILNSVIFAELGFFAAMKLSTYEEIAQVSTYILLPMTFICGTFFSTAVLPETLKFFVNCLPLTHTSQLLRSMDDGAIFSFLILVIYAVAGFLICRRAFQKLLEE